MIQLGIFAGLDHHIGKILNKGWFELIYDNQHRAQFEYDKYKATR
jgi:hypothetical protein